MLDDGQKLEPLALAGDRVGVLGESGRVGLGDDEARQVFDPLEVENRFHRGVVVSQSDEHLRGRAGVELLECRLDVGDRRPYLVFSNRVLCADRESSDLVVTSVHEMHEIAELSRCGCVEDGDHSTHSAPWMTGMWCENHLL